MAELRDRADTSIRHQIELERYKAGESNKMKAMLGHVNDDVTDRLEELNEKIISGQSKAFYTQKRLKKLSGQLTEVIENGFVDIHRTSTLDNRKLVNNELEWTADVLLSDIENVLVPTTRQVFATVTKHPFEGWVKQGKAPMTYANSSPLREVEQKYINDMDRSLKASYLIGATTRDAEKRLNKINENISRTKKNYDTTLRNTEAETRTAIQTYANRSMESTLIANGIEWELFLATLDLRTSEVCGTLDGSRWALENSGRPQIPVHWNCRSVYVPLFDKNEKLEGMRPQITAGPTYQKGDKYTSTGKVRKARRGDGSLKRSQISTDMDLNAWLSRQDRTDPQFVVDYFGSKKKYDDWKAGKLGKVSYFDNSGKRHSIDSLRFASIGDNVSAAPSLSMRSSNPTKYFIGKGGSKPISKKLDKWSDQSNAETKLRMGNDVIAVMDEKMIGKRINDSKRLKVADKMLKEIDIVGAPANADFSVDDFKKEFRQAVALYGTKIKGIKKVQFENVVVRSNVDDGVLLINNNTSNVYKEVGRFVAHNDKAYLEASKYFSTVDIDEVVADGFSSMSKSRSAFSLYKADPERFKFLFGIIDDKPKNIKIDVKSPSRVTKNKPIKPVNVDNAIPATIEHNTFNYYVKLGANTSVTRALDKIAPLQNKFNKAFKRDLNRFRTGEELLSPVTKVLRDKLNVARSVAIAKVNKFVIDSRVDNRLSKFKKVAKDELDSITTTQVNKLVGKELQDAKNVSAEAMSLINQRPATFRHLVKKGSRASANESYQYVNIGEGGKSVIFHEIGHHLEFSNPDVKKAAQEFVDKRSTGKVVKLKDLFPSGGYQDWESVLEDDFVSPYVGKVYSDGATEAISMGFEQFTSAASIIDFFSKDPEHFKFIFGILKEYDKLP